LPRAGALAVQTINDATPMTLKSDFALKSSQDAVHSMTLLDCQEESMIVSLSTRRGTTAQITVTKMKDSKNEAYQAATIWTAEEGLSSIQSALLLDTSHVVAVADGTDDETTTAAKNNVALLLSFSSRIQSHYKSLLTFLGILPQSDADAITRRDSFFGFLKVAVLLGKGQSLYGMSTSAGQGRGRGSLLYRLDLPETATWTRLIHGTTNSVMARHGINGATHARTVLVLSSSQSLSATSETGQQQLDWVCVDGTTGSVHSKGSFTVSSPVLQVVPMANPTTTSSCRQGAMLVLQDYSTVLVPHDDEAMKQAAHDVINSSSGENGLYAHAIFDNKPSSASSEDNHAAASLQSLFIPKTTSDNDMPKARLMGTALFPGEHVVAVAYPPRDEVIQSPCTVLGDDSLLLKYMNPHLVVIMTMTTTTTASSDDKKQKNGVSSVATEGDLFSAALRPEQKVSSSTTQKRKPIGVTTSTGAQNETAAASPFVAATENVDEPPNMFVNVMDSVSGRVLYRASHANVVATSPKPSMLISENWIFYTFMNARTRRAEIGVLSLYEGMIDRQGLTAFTRPEQSTQFSSWNARESQPVVLAKTFSIHKPATALGVTQTRGGISGRRLLLATLDGNVYAMERNALEPRRPLGPLKDSEKKEGLRQYSELLPTISYMSLSYHQVIASVQGIISAPTDLESQTMILAYGGPDLFYTRTSPSRGFDLLPDSFNRILLSIVVVGLIVLLLFVQSRVASKIHKQGWV
jgi:ER membrane protein complex subunit 1, C-terminal